MNKELLSKRIKEIRTEAGLSQAGFGALLFVSQDTVSLWECAKSIPNVEQLHEICVKFSVSANYLLDLEDYK